MQETEEKRGCVRRQQIRRDGFLFRFRNLPRSGLVLLRKGELHLIIAGGPTAGLRGGPTLPEHLQEFLVPMPAAAEDIRPDSYLDLRAPD